MKIKTNYTVFNLNTKAEWKAALKSFPEKLQDVYLSPEYYETIAPTGNKLPQCFFFELNSDKILYPFLLSPLSDLSFCSQSKFFDIEGAYGYNGPISTTNSLEFQKSFVEAFMQYCDENFIIAEFTRFNPIYQNHQWASHLTQINLNKNILVDLTIKDLMKDSYEHATRKNLNKAIRENLSVHSFSGPEMTKDLIEEFVAIYHSTMDRNKAGDQYYFDYDFFLRISKNLGEQAKFFFTIYQGKKISCELVLHNSFVGYSYLGGTYAEFYQYSPNIILKHEIIQSLKNLGLNYFCLGGGVNENDGIFKYKKSFAKNGVVDFIIGKQIYNSKSYDQIVQDWEKKFPEKKEKYAKFLLKYRL